MTDKFCKSCKNRLENKTIRTIDINGNEGTTTNPMVCKVKLIASELVQYDKGYCAVFDITKIECSKVRDKACKDYDNDPTVVIPPLPLSSIVE